MMFLMRNSKIAKKLSERNFVCYIFSLNAGVISKRTFSSTEKESAADENNTELEKKLQAEVETLNTQIQTLNEKNEDLLVS